MEAEAVSAAAVASVEAAVSAAAVPDAGNRHTNVPEDPSGTFFLRDIKLTQLGAILRAKGEERMEERVLLAEDEARMRTIVRDYFQAHGVACDLAQDGAEALELLRQRDYDAVLLDVLMPEADGFTVCRAVREHSRVPILFLTALGEERDMLRGYALGADDYVTKPFSLAVLLAKTRALIRRSRGEEGERLTCGAIALQPALRRCAVGETAVELAPRDYALLLCLMRNQGQVLSRAQLLDKVWGIDFDGGERAVDVRIRALRAALGPAGKQIRTVFKAGYRMEGG